MKFSNRTLAAFKKKNIPPSRMSGSRWPRKTKRSNPDSTPVISDR
ncbi:hypothetical protein ACFL5O_04490 [Myxococcota bacterium]